MNNYCNEWECPYNKNCTCTTNQCPKEEEMYDIIGKENDYEVHHQQKN